MIRTRVPVLLAAVLTASACGSDGPTEPPLQVEFGETTFVVLVNPVVNAANQADVPAPGTTRSGITVSVDGGPSASTSSDGVAVLSGVTAGVRTLTLEGQGLSGSAEVTITEGDLREVAVALTGGGAAIMANVRYPFNGEVVQISPSSPIADVNEQLGRSNIIVFLRGGTYRGDLRFSGSSVTLFGEGARGGQVTIEGNVTVDGSNNRIRGARITGDLSVPGSGAGISFSRVTGNMAVDGSSAVLLSNAFCGGTTLEGSNPGLLDNAGLEPIPASSGGC